MSPSSSLTQAASVKVAILPRNPNTDALAAMLVIAKSDGVRQLRHHFDPLRFTPFHSFQNVPRGRNTGDYRGLIAAFCTVQSPWSACPIIAANHTDEALEPLNKTEKLSPTSETGRRGDGETGRRGDGETGRRGDGVGLGAIPAVCLSMTWAPAAVFGTEHDVDHGTELIIQKQKKT